MSLSFLPPPACPAICNPLLCCLGSGHKATPGSEQQLRSTLLRIRSCAPLAGHKQGTAKLCLSSSLSLIQLGPPRSACIWRAPFLNRNALPTCSLCKAFQQACWWHCRIPVASSCRLGICQLQASPGRITGLRDTQQLKREFCVPV